MSVNDNGLYAAFVAMDTRFDGRFFVGVSSTGIYCRPVCRARKPKAENCSFYSSAAEAEQAGYRPCLLCRPELAPGTSITDAATRLAHRAARILEEACSTAQSINELAGRLGCTDRHLRRVFTAEYRVTPINYLQTCRLLLAKNLLTDTRLNVIDVAMAAGFGSVRRFNDLFKKHYNLPPTALRKQIDIEKDGCSDITMFLGYRPPYPWEKMLSFLAGRAITGVELVVNGEYMRAVRLTNTHGRQVEGWIRVGHRPKQNVLSVTMNDSLLSVLPQVLARIRHMFDLYCDPDFIYGTLRVMNDLRPGLCVLGTRVPGCFNTFEMAVRAVLGQQITVKAAGTLAARLVEAFGTPVRTEIEGLTHVFPSPEAILELEGSIVNHFGKLGIISARSRTIYELARTIVQGDIDFELCTKPEEEIKKLMSIPGIGGWTAQYIAMRAMEWPDAFLETDAGVKKALQPYTSRELLEIAQDWRPWRSYATVNLWNSL